MLTLPTKSKISSNQSESDKGSNSGAYIKRQVGFQTPSYGAGDSTFRNIKMSSQFKLENPLLNSQNKVLRDQSQKVIQDFVLAYNLNDTKKYAWLYLIQLFVVTGITKRLQINWQSKTSFTSSELVLLSLSNPW